MHQINVSLIGVAVSDVRAATTESGHAVARFRLVSRPRKFDSATGAFIDLDPSFVTILCWRHLADHVAASVRKGDQVVVTGRMRVREWEQQGRSRVSVEVEAHSVGLDLNRGPAGPHHRASSPMTVESAPSESVVVGASPDSPIASQVCEVA